MTMTLMLYALASINGPIQAAPTVAPRRSLHEVIVAGDAVPTAAGLAASKDLFLARCDHPSASSSPSSGFANRSRAAARPGMRPGCAGA